MLQVSAKGKMNLLSVVNKDGCVPRHNIPGQETGHGQKGNETRGQEPSWMHPSPTAGP